MSKTVVETVPHILHTTHFSSRHSPAIVVGGKVSEEMSACGEDGFPKSVLPLRWRATVVSKCTLGSSGIRLVQVEISAQNVVRPISFGTSSFVVSGVDHIRHLLRDRVHPLLPDVFVGLYSIS